MAQHEAGTGAQPQCSGGFGEPGSSWVLTGAPCKRESIKLVGFVSRSSQSVGSLMVAHVGHGPRKLGITKQLGKIRKTLKTDFKTLLQHRTATTNHFCH